MKCRFYDGLGVLAFCLAFLVITIAIILNPITFVRSLAAIGEAVGNLFSFNQWR